jgi:hypothetical protein
MAVYSFLQSNAALHDKLIKFDWQDLFTTAGVPWAVKQELRDICKQFKDHEINDAVLYWYEQQVLRDKILGMPFIPYDSSIWHTKWLLYCYTLIQQEKVRIDKCQKFLLDASVENVIIDIVPDFDLAARTLHAYETTLNPNSISALFYALCSYNANTETIRHAFRHVTYSSILSILKYCSIDMLKRLPVDHNDMMSLVDLLRDCDLPVKKFNSRNEIAAAHDARTERETKRLLSTVDNIQYHYEEEFIKIVHDNHLLLPKSPATLVIRGEQHHNCVATYADSHTHFVKRGVCSRIIMSLDATLELVFEVEHEVIVSTVVRQYKGAYNKNKEITQDITNMRVALTGQPYTILFIQKEGIKND